MDERHNKVIEHEDIPYEEALKYVKEDVTIRAITDVAIERLTAVLNDKLYTWEDNERRLSTLELWMVKLVIKINKIKITLYLIPIIVAILLIDFIARILEKI